MITHLSRGCLISELSTYAPLSPVETELVCELEEYSNEREYAAPSLKKLRISLGSWYSFGMDVSTRCISGEIKEGGGFRGGCYSMGQTKKNQKTKGSERTFLI